MTATFFVVVNLTVEHQLIDYYQVPKGSKNDKRHMILLASWKINITGCMKLYYWWFLRIHTCLCCIKAASSVCTRSISKRTGIARITKDVPATHIAERENLYNFFAPDTDEVAAFQDVLRTESGNISVNAHNRSAMVSSSMSSSSWMFDTD